MTIFLIFTFNHFQKRQVVFSLFSFAMSYSIRTIVKVSSENLRMLHILRKPSNLYEINLNQNGEPLDLKTPCPY